MRHISDCPCILQATAHGSNLAPWLATLAAGQGATPPYSGRHRHGAPLERAAALVAAPALIPPRQVSALWRDLLVATRAAMASERFVWAAERSRIHRWLEHEHHAVLGRLTRDLRRIQPPAVAVAVGALGRRPGALLLQFAQCCHGASASLADSAATTPGSRRHQVLLPALLSNAAAMASTIQAPTKKFDFRRSDFQHRVLQQQQPRHRSLPDFLSP